MTTASETLARSITRSANGFAYTTIRLLVDRRRIADAFRAYGYFRWVDDRLDLEDLDRRQALAFLDRQRSLIAAAYRGENVPVVEPEEAMLQDLVGHDPRPDGGLAEYVRQMMEVMAFDADRRGRTVTGEGLSGYTQSLATAVTEALHYFIGGSARAVHSPARYLAASGAHVAHMLRDTREDVARGYFNVPRERLAQDHFSPEDVGHPAYRAWVRERVELARRCLHLGRAYWSRVESLRCRVACLGYCLRFERYLDAIEADDFALSPEISACAGAGIGTTMILAIAAALRPPAAFATSAFPSRSSRTKGPAGAGSA